MAGRIHLLLDMMQVDRESEKPMYLQICDELRRLILARHIPANMLLPPTRALAEDLGVGRNTVIAAYDQLMAEGFIDSRTGSGTWVAELRADPDARAAGSAAGEGHALSRRGDGIAASAQPRRHSRNPGLQPGVPEVMGLPLSIWSNLLARNARSRDEALLSYFDYAGHYDLRRTIADNVALSRGIDCSAEQVIVVTGAQAALDLAARILMDPGDTVWMEEPGYLGATGAFRAAGGQLAPFSVSEDGWRLSGIDLPAPRLIYVTPSCQWPTGATMRIEERLQLLEIAQRHQAWIIEDDYDGEYRFRGRPIPALAGIAKSGRVIYVGSFGKTLSPSLRIGYLIVPAGLAPAFSRAISVTGQFAPLVLQATISDFIRNGHFAKHLKRMRRLYAQRQANFIHLCRARLAPWIDVAETAAGMQVLARFTHEMDDRVVMAEARARGLDVQGISLTYHTSPPRHGLLLGYAALDERQAQQAVALLQATFEKLDTAAPYARAESANSAR